MRRTLMVAILLASLFGPMAAEGQVTNTTDCIVGAVTSGPEPYPGNDDYLRWAYTLTNRCTQSVWVSWYERFPAISEDDDTWGSSNLVTLKPGGVRRASSSWNINDGGGRMPRPLLVYCGGRTDTEYGDAERKRCRDNATGAAIEATSYISESAKNWRSIG